MGETIVVDVISIGSRIAGLVFDDTAELVGAFTRICTRQSRRAPPVREFDPIVFAHCDIEPATADRGRQLIAKIVGDLAEYGFRFPVGPVRGEPPGIGPGNERKRNAVAAVDRARIETEITRWVLVDRPNRSLRCR
jgi:hypothetical protein